jgi:hypothetical protein
MFRLSCKTIIRHRHKNIMNTYWKINTVWKCICDARSFNVFRLFTHHNVMSHAKNYIKLFFFFVLSTERSRRASNICMQMVQCVWTLQEICSVRHHAFSEGSTTLRWILFCYISGRICKCNALISHLYAFSKLYKFVEFQWTMFRELQFWSDLYTSLLSNSWCFMHVKWYKCLHSRWTTCSGYAINGRGYHTTFILRGTRCPVLVHIWSNALSVKLRSY